MDKLKQKQKILNWLRTNGELTVREALLYMDINSPQKRVQELREQGYNIITIWRKNGSGTRYGAYKLIEEARS